jgi:hypothetical protein
LKNWPLGCGGQAIILLVRLEVGEADQVAEIRSFARITGLVQFGFQVML